MNAEYAFDDGYQLATASHNTLSVSEEQRWVTQYLPLVKRIVSQLALQANQVLDREDMEQIGLMGLLEGLRRYGTPDEHFGRFVGLRIRGAILDELRRQDWRPRQVRQHVHSVRDAIRTLERQLGRSATEEEIQRHTGLDHQGYPDFLQADGLGWVGTVGELGAVESLDELLQNGHESSMARSDGFEAQVHQERVLAQALARLSERERLILTLYYQQELNLKEIALVLGLSDARVCQLSKQALNKACAFLTADTES